MSCQDCEDRPVDTYVRIGNGNVCIIGCEKHLRELIERNRSSFSDTNKVTRVEVINWFEDNKGRDYTVWNSNMRIKMDLQDDDRTLKIFLERRKD